MINGITRFSVNLDYGYKMNYYLFILGCKHIKALDNARS